MAASEFVPALRDCLAECLESTATWRHAEAEEYPDDSRNRAAAERLREWADGVRQLPDNDLAFEPFVVLRTAAWRVRSLHPRRRLAPLTTRSLESRFGAGRRALANCSMNGRRL